MICKICNSESAFFSEGEILNKYKIKYYKCDECGFVQTEEPYWLKEAYTEVINKSDIGYAGRNLVLSKVTKLIINLFLSKSGKFLDYGAGYGLFVRLMRDSGYDFYWQDNYCENIFANGFAIEDSGTENFELVTGFELFEHFLNPVEEIEKILKYSKNVLVSTFLFPAGNPKPGEWWYYGLEHGQHISLYSYDTMKFLAKKYGLNLYTNKKNLHLFTERKLNSLMFRYISLKNIYLSLRAFPKKTSLHDSDYKHILEKLKGVK
ncbi:MAG TPA: class I SAM-dependent methyltransferase [Ignavibacteria bacterium]